jgi:hypothetical protein
MMGAVKNRTILAKSYSVSIKFQYRNKEIQVPKIKILVPKKLELVHLVTMLTNLVRQNG